MPENSIIYYCIEPTYSSMWSNNNKEISSFVAYSELSVAMLILCSCCGMFFILEVKMRLGRILLEGTTKLLDFKLKIPFMKFFFINWLPQGFEPPSICSQALRPKLLFTAREILIFFLQLLSFFAHFQKHKFGEELSIFIVI